MRNLIENRCQLTAGDCASIIWNKYMDDKFWIISFLLLSNWIERNEATICVEYSEDYSEYFLSLDCDSFFCNRCSELGLGHPRDGWKTLLETVKLLKPLAEQRLKEFSKFGML